MVTTEYKVAYSQVLEILKHISLEDYNKIPHNIIEMFKENSNIDSDFVYDIDKTLQEQNVSEITKTIIAILFRDYWATSEQKEKILSVQNIEREKIKKEKYQADNLFKTNKIKETADENIPKEQVALVEYKESFFKKIISKIKYFFGK